MSFVSRFVALKLGSQTIALGEFQTQPGSGLVLVGYECREILADPTREAERNRQIGEILPAMKRDLGIKHCVIDYAISAQSIFTRFINLPPIEPEKIDRIITFEAQQNVPFPIEEVVWDYQLIGNEPSQIEVVLVAIKADLLEEINATVEDAGLQTRRVDVATMALCNAFLFSYGDLTGCSLVVDLGARTTNLLFIEPGKIFSRSVTIGGSTITSAIAKEYNEPFAAAELRKKNSVVNPSVACTEIDDADVARVARLVGNNMKRLRAEVARSIHFYRTQHQGHQPERAYLCGGMASMPHLREFFRDKLQVPIELMNPLRRITVAPSVATHELADNAHSLGELVGLALRHTTTCPMQVNLRPANVVRRQRSAQRRPFFVLGGACLLLGLIAWVSYFLRIAHLEKQLADEMQMEVDRLRAFEQSIAHLRNQSAVLDSTAVPLIQAINDRGAWLRILDDLNARLPGENVWITELAPTCGRNTLAETGAGFVNENLASAHVPASARKTERMIDGIVVRGLYLSNPKQQEVVIDYFRNLLDSRIFNVDPNEQSEVIRPSTPTSTEWAYAYELHLKLRHPFALR